VTCDLELANKRMPSSSKEGIVSFGTNLESQLGDKGIRPRGEQV